MRRNLLPFALIASLALAAFAQEGKNNNQSIGDVAATAQAQATDFMTQCADEFGVPVEGVAVMSTVEDTSAAAMAAAGISELKREDFDGKWVDLGMISVSGPKASPTGDPTQPSGTYRVRVKATAGSSQGCFQIVNADGEVVQEGDMTIEVAPVDKSGATSGGDFPYYCVYPYWGYFRIYPRYWWGYWWWRWRWPWGYIRFHWWWWRPYWNCCGPWYWWWLWR